MRSSGGFLALRLRPGADLIQGLRGAIGAAEAVAIVTCVGSLTRVRLRHADRDEATLYEGRFEIVSLVGTLDPEGQHLHLSLADGDGQVWGGHLLPGSAVYTTAEIVTVTLDDLTFGREMCGMSGYRELVVTNR
ncbi:MAG: PPC domain-containing DNA-binding protein [Pseudomonadota bacterium]